MDPIKILKRALNIAWNYRALWVFGVILALTVGGSSGGFNFGNRWGHSERIQRDFSELAPGETFSVGLHGFREGLNELRDWINAGMPPFNFSPGNLQALLWVGIVFAVLLLILLIAAAIARYVSETALIRMVDEYEGTGTKTGVRQGFRYGWSRTSWRLFLINLLVNLPVFVLVLVLLLVGVGIYLLVIQGNLALTIAGIVGGLAIVFLFMLVVFLLSLVLNLLRHFFWRVCALQGVGVRAALRQGFALVRQNWKSVGLMWLVMVGVSIAWAVALLIVTILMIPLYLVTGIAGVILGGLPVLLVAGITSLFLSTPLPWIVGAIVGLPVFILVTFSPVIFLRGLMMAFASTVWTLTYRELNALQSLAPEAESA